MAYILNRDCTNDSSEKYISEGGMENLGNCHLFQELNIFCVDFSDLREKARVSTAGRGGGGDYKELCLRHGHSANYLV